MATITPQALSGAAAVTLTSASGGGDTVANAHGAILVVKNADSSSHTVTLVQKRPCSGGSNTPTHDQAVPVAAGATELIPINDLYVDQTTGQTSLTYSAVTSVSVGAYTT